MKVIIIQIIVFLTAISVFAQSPTTPILENVSVVGVDSVLLTWSDVDKDIVDEYQIYRLNIDNTSEVLDYNLIDSIASGNFSYLDVNGNRSSIRVESYKIRSKKNLQNGKFDNSLLSRPHSTMYLKDIDYDPCNSGRKVSWSPYVIGNVLGWPSNEFKEYNLVRIKSDGSVDLSVTTNDTVFVDNNSELDQDYYYYVEAVNIDGTKAVSNYRKTVKSLYKRPPSWIVAKRLLKETNGLKMDIEVSPDGELEKYYLYSNLSSGDGFRLVDSIQSDNKEFSITIDVEDDRLANYFVSVINECNKRATLSDTISNIVLSHSPSDDSQYIELKWLHNSQIPNVEYEVYRVVNKSQDVIIHSTLEDSYQDDISNNLLDNISYHINYGYTDVKSGVDVQIKSNNVIVSSIDGMIIPNAFIPNDIKEINRIFKPMLFNAKSLKFVVYNLYGHTVYESLTDVDAGWDGTVNGEIAAGGTYLYFAEMVDNEDRKFTKHGSLILILKD